MTLSPGVLLGPYEILAALGAGGMGEVYRAKDTRLGRTVAIKILPQHVLDHPARRQRFEREARAASRLSHPHICALYDVGEHDGIHFIVMEHLDGHTLAERLRRGPMPIPQILRCGIEIADALDHAHRAGIVHRDLKPANVMLTPAGAKLLDFGVARLTGPGAGTDAEVSPLAETEPLTDAGTIPGTLHYMAPEQLEGKETDARTDIFAFGTVVYEMTTARRAFDGASRASLIARILEHDPPPLSPAGEPGGARGEPLVPPALEHVVSRCLAKSPDERWQTAADLRQELKWIAETPSQIQPAGQRRGMRSQPRRVLAWLAAASVALAATAYVAATSWMTAEPSQPAFRQLTFRRGVITEARFLPDGQTVLYSAAWDGGPMQLYETRPGRPESSPREAPMTGLASVSSNELALLMGCRLEYGFCVGTLATKPLSGGAPRELAADVVAADWSPDARLAAIRRTGGEYRVEYPVGSRTLHRTTGRLNHLRFAPGGERLAFMEFPVLDEEIGSLKVMSLDGRVDTLTTGWRSIRGLQWSSRGDEIWFTGSRNGKACSLYAVSLSGTVRLILHAPGDVTLSDISSDGRVLLTYGPVRARMIWSGGEEERDLSWFDWPTVADLSTDGTTVLFHEWGEATGATPVMYTRRVDRADAVKLGDGKALALSPDGRWALGLVEKDRPQLVLHPTGAGSSRVLTIEDVTDVFLARWFPDSRRILVTALVDEGAQVFILDIENAARPQRIADVGTIGLLAHPDGRRILGVDPLGDHFMWPVDGGEPVPVAGLGSEDTPFQWSADARFLYLRGHDDDALRVYRYDLATGRRDPWRTLAPRDPTGLMGVATGRGEVAITPDGRGMVFNYWTWLGDLFLIEGAR